MAKITFILGGARSGKSTYALKLAGKFNQVAFIATCEGLDKEMKERINLHKKSRPNHWKTFEEPKDIILALKNIGSNFQCAIIDCLTLLVSNLILAGHSKDSITDKITHVLTYLERKKIKVIIVSNEVGLGIVPKNKLSRNFRDIAGKINQIVAAKADEVIFMVSGIPVKIKRQKHG
ncbi:MAG: bifunctional adenosylcobinamide kinase/adenosylcobinamide-phosphate guanylyltransferase [Candidatus Omnitrophica bacterium]|nr:bifunctional adenosylcobinamide kinase/adenosylcobinamide-phosphate guanylyltransferase [Candidatus Omnitrophota bacterium]MDD5237595.1 bifunctional adenosylcobinamide kinase/adenosylcobinamide-phosphate guanylyltransferase [Candidatus Omnitrophota bacterium]